MLEMSMLEMPMIMIIKPDIDSIANEEKEHTDATSNENKDKTEERRHNNNKTI